MIASLMLQELILLKTTSFVGVKEEDYWKTALLMSRQVSGRNPLTSSPSGRISEWE